jgi:ribosomal protein S4
VDKLVSRAGLAASRTEAARKLKEGAIKINGVVVSAAVMEQYPETPFVLQVGRKIKRVNISLP